MSKSRVQVVVSRSEAKELSQALREMQLDVSEPKSAPLEPDDRLVDVRFVDPVSIIVAGTLAVISLRIFDRLMRRSESGTVLDLRKEPFELSLVAKVPFGFIVVIDPNGESHTIKADETKSERMLADLISRFGKK